MRWFLVIISTTLYRRNLRANNKPNYSRYLSTKCPLVPTLCLLHPLSVCVYTTILLQQQLTVSSLYPGVWFVISVKNSQQYEKLNIFSACDSLNHNRSKQYWIKNQLKNPKCTSFIWSQKYPTLLSNCVSVSALLYWVPECGWSEIIRAFLLVDLLPPCEPLSAMTSLFCVV